MRQHLPILAFSLFLFACTDGASRPAEERLLAFCEEMRALACERDERCPWSFGGCETGCDDPTWQRMFQRLEEGRVRFDAAAAARCIRSTRDDLCGIPPWCGDVLAGAVAPGGACALQEDCAGGAFCHLDEACPGTCEVLPGPGEPCSAAGCAWGTFCHEQVCVAYRDEGEACEADWSDMSAVAGASAPRVCGPAPLTCEDAVCTRPAPLSPVGAGEACGEQVCEGNLCWIERTGRCPAGHFCDDEGICAPSGGPGDPCEGHWTMIPIGENVACEPGLLCHHGTCTAPAVPGDPCEGDCPGGLLCIDGTCQGQPATPGAPCDPDGLACAPSVLGPHMLVQHSFVPMRCDEASRTCVEVVDGNQPCDENDDCGSRICFEGRCVGACIF